MDLVVVLIEILAEDVATNQVRGNFGLLAPIAGTQPVPHRLQPRQRSKKARVICGYVIAAAA